MIEDNGMIEDIGMKSDAGKYGASGGKPGTRGVKSTARSAREAGAARVKPPGIAVRREKAKHIHDGLRQLYPEPDCTLDHVSALELLVATQLAAQSTDARVNIVTKDLFCKYRTVEDYAGADLAELERDIHSTGFYHNKARNLKACAIRLLQAYDGMVPGTMEELLTLPGVGRKTANVVLGRIFHVPGVIVDTHAGRLSRRMGLTMETDPEKVERDLMKILPKVEWTDFSHRLVAHGRAVCDAKKPKCGACIVRPYCETGMKTIE